jgi:uncharacterized RDD family membrane protein YckC
MQFRLAAAVAHRFSLFLAAFFLFLQSARAADLMPHDLVAHGDASQFWIARVEQTAGPTPVPRTTIYFRQLGQEGKWQPLTATPLPARVVSLASLNGLAAALLDDGSWTLLYSDSGPFTAGPLPKPARMVALAGGKSAWWAVGVVPGGISALPSTRAASTQVADEIPASRPATQPSEARMVLFTLIGNDWQPRAEFPAPVGAAPVVSLAIIDDTAYLANAIPGGVRVSHLEKDRWITDATIGGLPTLAGFKLLSTSQLPRLWVEPLAGADLIYSLNAPQAPIKLAEMSNVSPADHTIAVATGKIRVLGIAKGEVVEQDYGISDLRPDGGVSPVALPRPSPLAQLQQFQFWLVMAALALAIMGSFRQRAAMRDTDAKPVSIALAPLGRRFTAGLIDAIPAIVALAYGLVHFNAATAAAVDPNRPAILLLVYWSAAIFYIVYLTAAEALAGRSPGKLLLNLRIVTMDGKPAETGALITRNLLRIIDVGIGFLPALMIVLMPLRQRAGDVAAGTLVVRGDAQPEPQTTDEVAAASGATNATTPEQTT